MADISPLVNTIQNLINLQIELQIELNKLPSPPTGTSVVPVKIQNLQAAVVAARGAVSQAITNYNQAVVNDIKTAIKNAIP